MRNVERVVGLIREPALVEGVVDGRLVPLVLTEHVLVPFDPRRVERVGLRHVWEER